MLSTGSSPAQGNLLGFHHLGMPQGLSQSTSRTLFRDSRGFMWIGTAGGLNRFDGTRVRVYTPDPKDSTTIADLAVTGPIREDQAGNLWLTTTTALHVYVHAKDYFLRFTAKDSTGQPVRSYEVVHLDSAGILLVCGQDHLYRFDTRKAIRRPQDAVFEPVGVVDGIRFSFYETGHGEGWLLACGADQKEGLALYRYTGSGLQHRGSLFTGASGLPKTHVYHVWPENAQTLWCATSHGLIRILLAGLSFQVFDRFEKKTVGTVKYLTPVDNELLAVATSDGLYFFNVRDKTYTAHYEYRQGVPNALAGNNLDVLYLDRERTLWISVWTKGIDFVNLEKNKFQHFQPKSRRKPAELFVPGPLLESPAGVIWCGSQMHGLLALSPAGDILGDFSDVVAAPEQLFPLGKERLLINNFRQGFVCFDPKRRTARPILYNNTLLSGFCAAPVGTDSFLVTNAEAPGLVVLGFKKNEAVCTVPDIAALRDKFFYFIRRGRSAQEYFLVDYEERLYQLVLGAQPVFRQVARLPKFVTCAMAAGDDYWIGGAFGLLRISGTQLALRWVSKNEGLPDNMIYGVLQEKSGNLWLSTNSGLVRWQPHDGRSHVFSLSDGLQGLEFNRSSCLAAADGSFWFGGTQGLNRFFPDKIRLSRSAPSVQIVDILIHDAPWKPAFNVSEQTRFEFPFDSSTLTFHFAALEFSDPQNNKLQYRLDYADGQLYDKDWVACADAKGFARYAQLPPGRYRLQILAANSDGVWNSAPKQIDIAITPPYWQTAWFRALMAVAALAIVYGLYRYRLAQIRRAAAHRLDMAEAEMKALRAQLNPHFIFNSLNSVKAFLLRNDTEGANAYLGSFARLMRAILESSLHDTVRLEEELDLLREYVKTETKHLLHPVTYTETVDDSVDTFDIRVPGMLLQPFVENAIIHGLKPKNAPGTIIVRAELREKALLLSIEDDGVGRSPKNDPGHKSRALQIILERLKYYDARNKTRSGVQFVDLKDGGGTPRGTRVEIRLGQP